jgi:hypothetical protein
VSLFARTRVKEEPTPGTALKLRLAVPRARIGGVATKERLHQLIDELPDDDPDTDRRLQAAEQDIASSVNDDDPIEEIEEIDEGPIPTLEEVGKIFAEIDWLPREQAWH